MTYHSVEIIGHLGRDPESRFLDNGTQVTNFSVATSEKWKQDGESKERTIWWKVAAFGKLAEITNSYLKKGSFVFVKGQMTGDSSGNPRIWTAMDGTPKASFELKASEVKFISPRGGESKAEAEDGEEQIPF